MHVELYVVLVTRDLNVALCARKNVSDKGQEAAGAYSLAKIEFDARLHSTPLPVPCVLFIGAQMHYVILCILYSLISVDLITTRTSTRCAILSSPIRSRIQGNMQASVLK